MPHLTTRELPDVDDFSTLASLACGTDVTSEGSVRTMHYALPHVAHVF